METHTPGPWHVLDHRGTRQGLVIQARNPYPQSTGTVAEVLLVDYTNEIGEARALANARLIAASPTLLEALRNLAPLFDNDSPLLTVYAKEIAAAQAAIASAEGRS